MCVNHCLFVPPDEESEGKKLSPIEIVYVSTGRSPKSPRKEAGMHAFSLRYITGLLRPVFENTPHAVKFFGNRGPNLLNICAVMNIVVVSTIYI